jgi:hypothetical protein
MSELGDKTSGFADSVAEAARRNPISAALIGMGVLWLFAGKSTGRVGDLVRSTGLDHFPEATTDTFSPAKSVDRTTALREAAVSSFDAVREKGAAGIDAAAEFVQTAQDPVDVFEMARDNLTALFKAQPLALGAVGLAIGVGIAAAIPGTEVENAYLGEVSEAVRSKTAEIASHQVDKATDLATQVIDVAAEEARKQGLTPEGVKAAAGDFADKIGRVVDAAQISAADRAS